MARRCSTGRRRWSCRPPGGPLKLGAPGREVVRLTRRLSRLRSKAGTPYLDKPRKKVDATVETALKSFQNEHRLRAGRRLRAAQPAQAQPRAAAAGQAAEGEGRRRRDRRRPTTPAKRRRTLKTLVTALHHADAETGEAWDALVAHAAGRRRVLTRAQAEDRGARAGHRDGARRGLRGGDQGAAEDRRHARRHRRGHRRAVAAAGRAVATATIASRPRAAEAEADRGRHDGHAGRGSAGRRSTRARRRRRRPLSSRRPAPRRKELVDLSDEELLDRIARWTVRSTGRGP